MKSNQRPPWGHTGKVALKAALETLSSRAYHWRMERKVTKAQKGKLGTKFTTTNGVVGYVASEVPTAALEGLLAKLLTKAGDLKQEGSSNDHATTVAAGCNSQVSVSI